MTDEAIELDEGTAGAGGKRKKAPPRIWADPDLDTCPVVPLGYEDRNIWFALPGGELRCEAAAKVQGMLKTDIFAEPAGQAFIQAWVPPGGGDFQAQNCAVWLVQKCREAGKWDRNRPERGYGLWATPDGPVLHVGDALGRWPLAKGDWTPVAQALREERRGPIWKLAPPTPRPGKPAPTTVGHEVRRLLDMWRFKPIGNAGLTGADVVLGWDGMARMGACAPFRVHIVASGGSGTGKTTLSRFMQALGSANAGDLLDSFTEAGLRTAISGQARAVYLDEAEPSPNGEGPIEKALEMFRRMSTGDGAHRVQAEKAGAVMAQSAVGAAWLGAILPVELGDAMATRMVQVRLNLLGPAKGGVEDALEAARAWATEVSPGLLARSMREATRYRRDVSMMKAALGETGRLPRTADLVAALAAGRRLLLFDEALTIETAREEVRLWAALLDERDQSGGAVNAGQACLMQIFALNSGQHYDDRYLTLGEVIQRYAGPDRGITDPEKARALLKAWGLRVEWEPPEGGLPGPWLWVSNDHPALKKALSGTRYANWRGALDQLDDLGEAYAPRALKKPPRFGTHQSRALAVPLTPWLEGPIELSRGVGGSDPTPFDPVDWERRDASYRTSSQTAYRGETHD